MWLLELKDRDIEFLQKRASICAQAIAEKGDVLMYASKKKGAAGEVFDRLAEGMACLCLITRHPVPFNKRVFNHDGTIETFETEAEANERVWPSVPKMQETDQGPFQSETVPGVRNGTKAPPADVPYPGPDSAGKKNDRKNGQG